MRPSLFCCLCCNWGLRCDFFEVQKDTKVRFETQALRNYQLFTKIPKKHPKKPQTTFPYQILQKSKTTTKLKTEAR